MYSGDEEVEYFEGVEIHDLEAAEVDDLPTCDFCEKVAAYDGATMMGPWANMCEECFELHGIGLGTGKGQKLIL